VNVPALEIAPAVLIVREPAIAVAAQTCPAPAIARTDRAISSPDARLISSLP
jgi:hypothetical protein